MDGGKKHDHAVITRKRNDRRTVNNAGLLTCMRIALTLCHLHHIAIARHDASASTKSPAKPARKACGVTSATNFLASLSSNGSAANNVFTSHSLRSARVGCRPFCGRKTKTSFSSRSMRKCQSSKSAAVNCACTDKSPPYTR